MKIGAHKWYIEETCPSCGGKVFTEPSCPGIKRDGTVMVCNPPSSCGNATEFICDEDECGWWYRYPVGERSIRGMGIEPSWDMEKYLI